MRLDVQYVDLADVIEAALETAAPTALARNICLQKVLDPAVAVSGDPGRLQHCLEPVQQRRNIHA
jgi:signal transduction histidine kinase